MVTEETLAINGAKGIVLAVLDDAAPLLSLESIEDAVEHLLNVPDLDPEWTERAVKVKRYVLGEAEPTMTEAIRRQRWHVAASQQVDRTGWTRQQWIDDARRLMGDVDGSVLDLVNGHVTAMLEVIDGGDPSVAMDDHRARARERQER